MQETLKCQIDHGIATITFCRPDAMNSFDKQMADELEHWTDLVRADDNVRAVLINGTGKLFMAGGDLNFFYDQLHTMPKGVMKIVRTLNASIVNLMKMPKPVVASVHGSVAGVGVSLMMACDLAIAADTTKFTMAYSNIGISPDGGAAFNLPRLVGVKKAMEWILFSEVFSAEVAARHGLVNWVVREAELNQATQNLMARLAHGPTLSYAHTKRLINDSWHHHLETHLEHEGKAFEACSASRDFKEGVTNFLQKKMPEFTGC